MFFFYFYKLKYFMSLYLNNTINTESYTKKVKTITFVFFWTNIIIFVPYFFSYIIYTLLLVPYEYKLSFFLKAIFWLVIMIIPMIPCGIYTFFNNTSKAFSIIVLVLNGIILFGNITIIIHIGFMLRDK